MGLSPSKLEQSCGQRRRSPRTSHDPSVQLKFEHLRNSRLCNDCISAVELAAQMVDLDDTDSDSLTRDNETKNSITQHGDIAASRSTSDHIQSSHTELPHENFIDETKSIPATGSGPIVSRIVSPVASKSRQSIKKSSTLCISCNVRTVPEEYMEYCKRCYAKSCKKTKSDASFEKTVTAKCNRCRLCTGVVMNASHQYCFKCYTAKQRDDAIRIQRELYQKQFKKESKQQPIQHIPYICMDCGGTIHDCSWKTKCPPCYEKVRASLQGKPKLMKPPIKRQFQQKPKYGL
jgi:hypothetical protein